MTATLTIIHLLADGAHTVQHIRAIPDTSWDQAVLTARDAVRERHSGGTSIVSAVLSADPMSSATTNKVFQPHEWQGIPTTA